MDCQKSPVDRILEDMGIDDAVKFLEEVQDEVKIGFSKEPTVFVVGNIELAREKNGQYAIGS